MAAKHKKGLELIRLLSSAGTGYFYTTEKNKRTHPDKMEKKMLFTCGSHPKEDLAPWILKKLMYQVISHSKRFGEKRKISNSAWSILTVILAKTAI